MNRQHGWLGLQVNKNIYSRDGALIIPKDTVLTYTELQLLAKHRVILRTNDVEEGTTMKLVGAAVAEMEEVFRMVESSHQIPFEKIQYQIVPMITELSIHSELRPIFEHLEKEDDYTYRHSIGVALLSHFIGKLIGLNGAELDELTAAALLHDIGKASVRKDVLHKPARLSKEEFLEMKKHTIYGYELILNASGCTNRQALVALQHHEREDGTGYPYRLYSEQIEPFSKIVAIADVFHAMLSRRVYKEAIPLYRVLRELRDCAYHSLEPEITLNFLNRIMEMLVGSIACLSDGRQGKIVMVNPVDPTSPLVEVDDEFIDLSQQAHLYLERII